ncbi:sensor histidine kinase, partial [Thermoactinospora rubra]|uniref:sensor histidine kinase n=1 Tax=Thermoactinospora rubra TaxID=1088767 RepID=UPI0019803E84
MFFSLVNDAEGPAEQALQALGRRQAANARVAAVAVSGALELIAGSHASPVLTFVAVVAAVIGCIIYYANLIGPRKSWLFVLDVVLTAAFCLSQAMTVSAGIMMSGAGWVQTSASIAVIVYQWHTTPAGGAVATLLITAAYLLGLSTLPYPIDAAVWLRAPWLIVEAVLSRCLWVLLKRGGRLADVERQRDELLRCQQAVAAARRAEEREYLAALHDTAATTLLLVSAGMADTRREWLSEQARRDVKVLIGQRRYRPGSVDLRELIHREAQRAPLTSVRISAPSDSPVLVPPDPAAAICGSISEALANVERHAGVDSASIHLVRFGQGVLVEVIDEGRGFAPDEAVSGQGLTLSIIGRMESVGGRAYVDSRPGIGTRISLQWVPEAMRLSSADTAKQTSILNVGTAVTTAARFERALQLALLAVTSTILLTWELAMLITHAHLYRFLSLQIVAFTLMIAVIGYCAFHMMRGRLLGRERWVLAGIIAVATLLSTLGEPFSSSRDLVVLQD